MSQYKARRGGNHAPADHLTSSKGKFIIIVVLLACLGGFIVWYIINNSNRFPYEMTLTDLEGRVLDVRIVARSKDMVQFDRIVDDTRFTWPIDSLIEENREIILRLPNTGLIENPVSFAPRNLRSGSNEGSWVEHRRDLIRRLQHDIAQLHYQQAIATDRAHRQALGREIHLKHREITRIEKTIHDYLHRPE